MHGAYYGKLIGSLQTNAHGVSGKVYAASENTFYLVDFHYDGQGPEAFFWASTDVKPVTDGTIVPDETGGSKVLRKYTGETFRITVPDGKKITDYKSLAVWCRKFAANFGWVMIPSNFELPKEQHLAAFKNGAHGVSSDRIVLKDSKTALVQKFTYDGAGPDAHFLVGTSAAVVSQGATKVPDENGSHDKLKGYTGKDVTIQLPGNTTWGDVRWLSVYCIAASQDFAHVSIPLPEQLHVPIHMAEVAPSGSAENGIGQNLPSAALVLGMVATVVTVFSTWECGHRNRKQRAAGR